MILGLGAPPVFKSCKSRRRHHLHLAIFEIGNVPCTSTDAYLLANGIFKHALRYVILQPCLEGWIIRWVVLEASTVLATSLTCRAGTLDDTYAWAANSNRNHRQVFLAMQTSGTTG